MLSIHSSSIQKFINDPADYHLVNQGGTIKAVHGRLPADEQVHEIALKALNALPFSSPLASASVGSSAFDYADLVTGCKQAEFSYKIKEWALSGAPQENRAEAAKRMIKAYTLNMNLLDLAYLTLSSLPKEIGNLTQLTELKLNHNQLTHLPPEFGNLTQVIDLQLGDNQLIELSPKIGNLTQLIYLDLSDNQLAHLPPEIGKLSQLTELRLNNNQFTHLPPEISKLGQLRKLDLYHNQLTHLPPEIGNLTQLTELDLSNNQLTHLPSEIGNLTQLIKLDLLNIPITNGRTEIEVIAAYPFLLKIPPYKKFLDAQNLQAICQINGLSLKFIPDDKKTTPLVSIALTQNPASIAFMPPRLHHLINFDIAKRAVAIDPALARFVPNEVIDVTSLLSQLEANPYLLKEEPYLLSLLIKVGALDKISDTMYEDAIIHDYRLLGCMPLAIQNSSLGDNLITYALRQNPKAYYMIEPHFFNEKMLNTMIQDCQHHHDLEPVLRHIISKMNTQDQELVLRMSNLAYPLLKYFHHDKEVLLMLISKYGITLEDLSHDLKADYDIVFNAIHNQPDDIKFSFVSEADGQKDLIAYAQERKRQLGR